MRLSGAMARRLRWPAALVVVGVAPVARAEVEWRPTVAGGYSNIVESHAAISVALRVQLARFFFVQPEYLALVADGHTDHGPTLLLGLSGGNRQSLRPYVGVGGGPVKGPPGDDGLFYLALGASYPVARRGGVFVQGEIRSACSVRAHIRSSVSRWACQDDAYPARVGLGVGRSFEGGDAMAGAKLIVIYPTPRDVSEFERAYTQDHAPMVTPQTFAGLKKFVASKVVGTADGSAAPFYRVAELHFGSMDALKAAAGSASAQKAVAHALSISTGGTPLFLVAEEETKTF